MTAFVTIVRGVDAPELTPRTARLLDTVPPIDGIEWADPAPEGEGIYTSLACIGADQSTDICEEPLAPNYQDPELVNSFRFVSDIGVKCQSLAFAGIEEKFNRVVELRESDSVELNVMAIRFAGVAGGDAAVDITPTGTVSPAKGLALLEGDAAVSYAGRPIIHAPVTVASILSGGPNFASVGQTMSTSLGNRFVAGGGYEANFGPDGQPAPAGSYWMYATGEMRIRRGKRIQSDPILNRSNNLYLIRSQRVYVVDVDCYLAAVKVTI